MPPKDCVALGVHVAGDEGAFDPGKAFAFHRIQVVIEAVVSEDCGFRVVFSPNQGTAVDDAVRLVKIDGLRNIRGNHSIVLKGFGDAIDLHGEQDGYASAVQFSGQHDDGGSSPTLAKENDAGMSLFLIAQNAVVIGIEQVENRPVGRSAVTVFEDLDVRVFRSVMMHVLGEKYWAVMDVVMTNESADEADQDAGGLRRMMRGTSVFCGKESGCGEQD